MTPMEFINFDGDSSPDTDILDIHKAMNTDIEILAFDGDYTILSYYFDENSKKMILDIKKKEGG